MRKFAIFIGILILAFIAALFILPGLVPASVYKSKIEEQISTSLGRKVTIGGDVKLSVLPVLKAKAQSVSIANAPGFSLDNFADVKTLEARVKLLPLLSKKVEISKFNLVNANINLSKSKTGAVNWVFGAKDTEIKPQKPAKTAGPFRRDGRYTDLDLSLGEFALKNGQISYRDDSTNTRHTIKDINAAISLAALDKPLSAKGRLVFDDTPMNLDLKLNTPKSFLKGENAPLNVQLKSNLITLRLNGAITPSKIISFDVDFDGDIPSVSALDKKLGLKNPYGPLSERANLKGNLVFDGKTLRGKNAALLLSSTILKTEFHGDFTALSSPSANGDLKIDIADVKKLAKIMEFKIPQIGAVDTLNISTQLKSDGITTTAQNLNIRAKGGQLNASYQGGAIYNGTVKLDGDFRANSPSLPALLSQLAIAIPQASLLGDLDVKGHIKGPADTPKLSNFEFATKSAAMAARYSGNIDLNQKAPGLDGQFNLSVTDSKAWLGDMAKPLPYLAALGTIEAKGHVKGTPDAIALKALDAKAEDGLVNFSFKGDAKTTKAKSYDYIGDLTLDIPSLRNLASLGGVKLTPSSSAGAIYEALKISGKASGTNTKAKFENANIAFDDLKAAGQFTVNLMKKPKIDGKVSMPGLDLRPYMAAMAAQNPKGKIQPWSEQPINFAVLRLFDGKLDIDTKNIITDRMEMGATTIASRLKDGVLTSKIPNVSLYGGKGRLDLVINAQGNVPQIAMDFTLDQLDGKSFLGAAAGFTRLTGNTGSTMKIRAKGRSQAEIMRSLDGQGNFQLSEGVLTGIDLAKFIGGLDTAFKTRALPQGIGENYTTPFNRIRGLFDIENGVVKISTFNLSASNVMAEGGGALDLGKQYIDFSLRPRLKAGKGLAAFGIPIRLQGGFGGVKAGLDTELMSKIIAARAKQELTNQLNTKLGDKLGGDVGGLVEGLLGPQGQNGGQPATNPAQGGTKGNTQGQTPSQNTKKDPLGTLLGDVLNPQKKNENPSSDKKPAVSENSQSENPPTKNPQTDPKKTDEKKKPVDPLEKALGDLFGGD